MGVPEKGSASLECPKPLEREWPVGNEAEGSREPGRDFHTPVRIWSQSSTRPSDGTERTSGWPGLRNETEKQGHLSSNQPALHLTTT